LPGAGFKMPENAHGLSGMTSEIPSSAFLLYPFLHGMPIKSGNHNRTCFERCLIITV
jgi:hypothetical protein